MHRVSSLTYTHRNMALSNYSKISDEVQETLEYSREDLEGFWRFNCAGVVVCKRQADNRRTACVLNAILFVASGAATAFGLFLFVFEILNNSETRMYTERVMMGLAVVLASTGGTAVFVSVITYLALCKQKSKLMRCSVMFWRILILVEMSVAALGLCYQTQVSKEVQSLADWPGFVALYHKDAKMHLILDSIQTRLQCCGFTSYQDWEKNSYYACTSTSTARCGVPPSCCKGNSPSWYCSHRIRAKSTNETERSQKINTRGCLGFIEAWTKYNLILISAASLFLVSVHIMLFSVTKKSLKQHHRTRESSDEEELNPATVQLEETNKVFETASKTTRKSCVTLHRQFRDLKAEVLCKYIQGAMRQEENFIEEV